MRNPALLLSLVAVAIGACGSSSSSTPPTIPEEPAPPSPHADVDAGEPPVAQVPDAAPAPPEPDPAQRKGDLLAAEKAAFDIAKPVFDKYCAGCHVAGKRGAKKSTLEHFDMTTYPFGGHHADKITEEIREVLGIGGGKPTMPKTKPGAVKGDELAAISAWADAFDASHAAGAHEGMDHAGDHGQHKH